MPQRRRRPQKVHARYLHRPPGETVADRRARGRPEEPDVRGPLTDEQLAAICISARHGPGTDEATWMAALMTINEATGRALKVLGDLQDNERAKAAVRLAYIEAPQGSRQAVLDAVRAACELVAVLHDELADACDQV